jgi:hypothetical protein
MTMKHNWKTWGRVVAGLVLLGLLVFGLSRSAWAADFRGGDNVIISEDEVIDDDLFVSGNRVEVDGTVRGDLFASGTEVVVNGQVEGSLFIAGQTLEVNGQVDGSVYGGGYALTIGREVNIGRNLYFGGFSLTTEKSSVIGHSLYAGNYQTILDGEVANDVAVGSGALEVNGIVGGDVRGEVGSPDQPSPPPFMPNFPGSVPMVAPGLRVGENAEIGGNLDVEVVEAEVEVDLWSSIAGFLARAFQQRVGEFIALLIVGGLLLYFWPNIVQRASTEAQARPLANAGRGCLVTLLFPIGVIIVGAIVVILAILGGLITFGHLFGDILGLGGTTLGLVVVVFSLIFSLVTKAIVAFLGGRLILTRLVSQMSGWWLDFASLVLGAIVYEILRVIPVLGWIVSIIVILVGLGAIYVVLRQTMRPSPPATAPTPEVTAA